MTNEKPSQQPSKLPKVERDLHCLRCGGNTKHSLCPVLGGAEFVCVTCGNVTQKFTHSEMAEVVLRKVFKLPKHPPSIPIPDGFKVFLKHHGPTAEEMEASPETVANHVFVTGQLPTVGKPLYAAVGGAKELALPFGEVVRVEGAPDE